MIGELVIANRIVLEAEPPSRILIAPWGKVERRDGGHWIVSAEGAAAMVAAFERFGTDVPIDLEHQTLGEEFASPDGSAPAVGWIKSVEPVEGDGIYTNVEWTKQGAEWISTKAYRYLSPVVMTRKDNGHAVRLHSAALTNTPMIVGMVPIVNKEVLMINSDEVYQEARWFLKLPITATEQDIMDEMQKLLNQMRELAGVDGKADQTAVINALKAKIDGKKPDDSLRVSICKALKLGDDSKADDVVAAVNKLTAEKPAASDATVNPKDWVPASEHEKQVKANKDTSDRLKAVEDELAANKCAAFIERGEREGKIVSANRAMWERSYKADAKAAEEDLKTAPEFAPPEGRMVNTERRTAPAAGGDAIVANAARFDGESMADYKRIDEYAKANKCTFEQAMEACGAM